MSDNFIPIVEGNVKFVTEPKDLPHFSRSKYDLHQTDASEHFIADDRDEAEDIFKDLKKMVEGFKGVFVSRYFST